MHSFGCHTEYMHTYRLTYQIHALILLPYRILALIQLSYRIHSAIPNTCVHIEYIHRYQIHVCIPNTCVHIEYMCAYRIHALRYVYILKYDLDVQCVWYLNGSPSAVDQTEGFCAFPTPWAHLRAPSVCGTP